MRRGISIRLVVAQALLISFLSFNDAQLKLAAAEQPANTHLYFITNEGCAPCRQVEPSIEALKREGYPVSTVNFDANRQWAMQQGVDRTPTVVLISNDRIVGRHAGLIDAVTLKKWFSAVGIPSGAAFAAKGADAPVGGTKVVIPESSGSRLANGRPVDGGFSSPTMHKGTSRPRNSLEQLAMQATVRLKVEDPLGTSYATGTVVHSHRGESLVVTCGHVFRDAQGAGKISAEYGFDSGNKKSVAGELIFYDSDARDIGLVAIQTPDRITPVKIANKNTTIQRGRDVFSIGCDHGEDPTIRRTQIKRQAAYDGAIKYDIYGRPVDGRSGGGLFTGDGELIGVCNAAAVEVDEGIYTALDTIYWQLARVNLEHLFDNRQLAVAPRARSTQVPVDGAASQTFARAPAQQRGFSEVERMDPAAREMAPISREQSGRTNVSWNQQSNGGDKEVIILVRTKGHPSQTETITIGNPTSRLLNVLDQMSPSQSRQLEMARLRTENQEQRR